MDDAPKPVARTQAKPAMSGKEQRLAKALRDNLRRRKAAGQAGAPPPAEQDPAGE